MEMRPSNSPRSPRDCSTCRGNEVLDDGYPCPDCRLWDDGEDDLWPSREWSAGPVTGWRAAP